MVAEWLWIQAGRQDVESIAKYNSKIANYSDDGVTFTGAYGPRLAQQWNWVIENLKHDPDSRQAVMTIFSPSPGTSKDIPCTLSLQVFQRFGMLHGIVTMRSQDLWLGLPHDFFNFSQMVNGLAGELGYTPGSLTFNVGSSHIYQHNCDGVNKVLLRPSHGYHVRSPRQPGLLPAEMILNRAGSGYMLVCDHYESALPYCVALRQSNKKDALRVLKTLV